MCGLVTIFSVRLEPVKLNYAILRWPSPRGKKPPTDGSWLPKVVRGRGLTHYQNTAPPPAPAPHLSFFFLEATTVAPLMAASWAMLGATPGGGGGIDGRVRASNRAPALNAPCNTDQPRVSSGAATRAVKPAGSKPSGVTVQQSILLSVVCCWECERCSTKRPINVI